MLEPPKPLAPDLRSRWLLNDRITFLNHGSFGAVPNEVFDEQTRWRIKIESDPIELMLRRVMALLDTAKQPVASWLGMRAEDFGFVTNATEAILAVLRSLDLKPGDELLTTTHVYGSIRQCMRNTAERGGADFREIDLPLPIRSPEQIEKAIVQSLGSRTKLVVIDHITSPTAVVFPVESIVKSCQARGIDVLIDGAHAPGMIDLNISKIAPAYYAANLHKWTCAPKGSAFLWVRPDRQAMVHPPVISHHYKQGFAREFNYQGTRDLSAWLSVPKAIEFMSGFSWPRVMTHNHSLAAWAHEMLCKRWGVEPITPIDGSMLGSMATVPLPPPLDELEGIPWQQFQQRLYDEFQIEAPLMRWSNRTFIRPSCQIYNAAEEYEKLADAVLAMR